MTPRQRIVSAGYAINSEKLDSQNASYYRNASNINSGVLAIPYGGTSRTSKLTTSQTVGNDAITSNSSWTTMSGMSTTFATYGTKLLILWEGQAVRGAQGVADIRIKIDGNVRKNIRAIAHASYMPDMAYSMHWLETNLVSGSHSVIVEWQTVSGQAPLTLDGSYGARVLTCVDLD